MKKYIIIEKNQIENRLKELLLIYKKEFINNEECSFLLELISNSKDIDNLEYILEKSFDAGINWTSPNIRPEDRLTKKEYIKQLNLRL